MKTIKIILSIIGLLIFVLFIVSIIPSSGTRGAKFEKTSFDLKSCSLPGATLSNWNGHEFYMTNEPNHKYLDELRKKFINSGLSENYVDKNIKLIYADLKEGGAQIDAWFMIKTNSWLDNYNPNYGDFFPICREADKTNCDICKYYVTRIHGWVNLNYTGNSNGSPVVYSIQGKVWHDDKVVESEHNVPFKEIKKVLNPWTAGLISKTCVPISLNRYSVFLSPKMIFEYVVNGENLTTLFDPMKQMQARVNLATGEVECNVQQSIIY